MTYKQKEDPLTQADLLVHKILSETIESIQPGSTLLSEEGQITNSSEEEIWILDPIDGTREFVKKNNQFAISLAYLNSSGEYFGIILNPSTGDLFLGDSGSGICYSKMQNPKFPNGEKPWEMFKGKPASILVSNTEFSENLFREPYWSPFRLVPMGSIAYKLGLVGVGLHDLTVSLKPKNDWDIAAGVCIVRAGGGEALTLDGKSFNFFTKEKRKKGILAGPKEFVEDFIQTYKFELERDWRDY